MTRTALELADALDRCQDELLVFGSDFYHPVGEAAHMLRKLHIMDEYAINEIAALQAKILILEARSDKALD
jgi:predicted class III extradiol MEMO1 family dioxygenase